MTSNTPVAITSKTVVYLPNRHPARVWKSEPGTVSFNLACEGGWADQGKRTSRTGMNSWR